MLPPDPFHSSKKNFVLHVVEKVNDKLTDHQRDLIDSSWRRINVPKGMRHPLSPWRMSGKNFDELWTAMFIFPSSCRGVLPKEVVHSLEKCFFSLRRFFIPGEVNEKNLSKLKNLFVTSLKKLNEYIDLNFPTTHHIVSHLFDYSPILSFWVNWDAKKFEVEHRFFKKRLKRCFLKNPVLYLMNEYLKSKNLNLLFQNPEKWIPLLKDSIYFIPSSSFSVFEDHEEKDIKECLGADVIVEMKDIRVWKRYTLEYEVGEEVVLNDRKTLIFVERMIFVKFLRNGNEILDIAIQGSLEEQNQNINLPVDKIMGKPIIDEEDRIIDIVK